MSNLIDQTLNVEYIDSVAGALMRKKLYGDATELFERALKHFPQEAKWWSQLGQCLEMRGYTKEAYEAYEAALKLRPDRHEYWNNCGVALALLGNVEGAEIAFAEAIKINPKYHNATFNIRTLRSRQTIGYRKSKVSEGDHEASEFFTDRELEGLIQRMKAAARQAPYDLTLKLRLSFLLDRSGKTAAAISLLNKVIKLEPDNADAWLFLADIEQRAGQTERAISSLKKAIALIPLNVQLQLQLAELLLSAQHPAEARETVRSLIEAFPESSECWALWARILELNDDKACFQAFYRAAELAVVDANLWHKAAVHAKQMGYIENAIHCLQRSLEHDPQANASWNTLGRILEDLGRHSEAEEIYRKVIDYDPHAARALNNLGVLLTRRGDVAGGEAAFRKAIDIAPDFVNPWYNLRDILLSRGDLSAASEAKRRARRAEGLLKEEF